MNFCVWIAIYRADTCILCVPSVTSIMRCEKHTCGHGTVPAQSLKPTVPNIHDSIGFCLVSRLAV